ncbi:MAG: hypothetical protein EOM72_11635 [Opitutae bacterium]|nr:hypothetical protein [Opitutae bacterium]
MKPFASRLLKSAAALFVALLLLHAVLLVASGRALRHAREELRAAGRPMSAKEIIPPDVLRPDNAALLYKSAFALLKSESIGNKSLVLFVTDAAKEYAAHPDSDAFRLAFENSLANPTISQALELVEQATTRTQCNFNLQYDLGSSLRVPHINDMLNLGRILNAKALLHARRGEPQQAHSTLETALRMADALRDEPILISALVRNAQYNMALDPLPALCTIAPPDDETAARLSALLDGVDPVAPFVRALDGERLLYGEWLYARIASGGVKDLLGPGYGFWTAHGLRLLGYRPSLQLDHAFSLRTYARFAADAQRPFWEIQPPPRSHREEKFPWYATISRFVMPTLNVPRITQSHALLRVSRTGLALLRHKLAHGAYPAALAEIDPQFLSEVPLDPFTGHPLVYRTEGDGFVLYSLGENLKDDGGKKTKDADIAWRTTN